jgi:hypothetical protein
MRFLHISSLLRNTRPPSVRVRAALHFVGELPVELRNYLILKSETADLETWLKIS